MSTTKTRSRGSLSARLLEGIFVGVGIGVGIILMQVGVYAITTLLLN